MTCTCNCLSPFLWKLHPQPSMFLSDEKFAKAAATGKTMSQIASATVERVTQSTGRSPGSIRGLSARGNLLIEEIEAKRGRNFQINKDTA